MRKRGALALMAMTAVLAFAGCKKEEKTNVYDYITLGQYKGIEVSLETGEVTDENIDARIDRILKENQEFIEVERASVEGDKVNIDVTGEVAGAIDDGFTSEGYDIILGSGVYIMDGFQENLYNLVPGQEVEFKLIVPDNFSSQELVGQEVTFRVTVNSVMEGTIPELNDEFVSKVSEVDTVDAFREYIKEVLTTEIEMNSENYKKSQVLTAVLDNSEVIQYPEGSVEKQIEEINEKYNVYATLQEISVDEYIQKNFGNTVQVYAEELVKEELILAAIQEEEKITLTDAEYKEKLPAFAEKYAGMDADVFEDTYGVETIKQAMLWDKIIDFLVENAVFK